MTTPADFDPLPTDPAAASSAPREAAAAESETERLLKALAPAPLPFDREKFFFEAGRRAALAEVARTSLAAPATGAVWRRRFLGAASHAAAALAAGLMVWFAAAGADPARSGAAPGGLAGAGPAVAGAPLPGDAGKGLAVQAAPAAGPSDAPPTPDQSPQPTPEWNRLTPAIVYAPAAEPSLVRWLDRLETERAAEQPSARTAPRDSAPVHAAPLNAAPPGRFRNDARTLQSVLDARDA